MVYEMSNNNGTNGHSVDSESFFLRIIVQTPKHAVYIYIKLRKYFWAIPFKSE